MELIDPPERRLTLGDGFRVEVRVVLQDLKDVPQVPTSALFRDEQGWKVFAVENGRAVRRAVEVGHQNGLAAEIRSGLKEGDQVKAGQAVLITEAMKMETEVQAPIAGTVKAIHVAKGDRVNPGEVLVEIA